MHPPQKGECAYRNWLCAKAPRNPLCAIAWPLCTFPWPQASRPSLLYSASAYSQSGTPCIASLGTHHRSLWRASGLSLCTSLPYTGMRLVLLSLRGVTTATVAKLSSLQRLTSLTTDLYAPRLKRPMDLAEYAQFTGALQGLCLPTHAFQLLILQACWCARPRVEWRAASCCCRAAAPARGIPAEGLPEHCRRAPVTHMERASAAYTPKPVRSPRTALVSCMYPMKDALSYHLSSPDRPLMGGWQAWERSIRREAQGREPCTAYCSTSSPSTFRWGCASKDLQEGQCP